MAYRGDPAFKRIIAKQKERDPICEFFIKFTQNVTIHAPGCHTRRGRGTKGSAQM